MVNVSCLPVCSLYHFYVYSYVYSHILKLLFLMLRLLWKRDGKRYKIQRHSRGTNSRLRCIATDVKTGVSVWHLTLARLTPQTPIPYIYLQIKANTQQLLTFQVISYCILLLEDTLFVADSILSKMIPALQGQNSETE